MFMVLFMSDPLSSVWGHSVRLAKFAMCSHSFHSVSTEFSVQYGNQEGIQAMTFSGDLPS